MGVITLSRRFILCGAAIFLLGTGMWRFSRPAATRAEVASAVVARRDLSAAVMATGTIRPKVGAEVKVGSRVSGLLQKLHFNIGDEVRTGELIAELDDRDLRARVAQAEAGLQVAEARLTLLRRGSRPQEIAQIQMAVRDAEANLSLAEKQFQRQSALYKEKLVARDTLDVAEKNLDAAGAKVLSTGEQLELVKKKFLPEDLQMAEAQVKQARASLELARTQLSYTRIVAPIGGMIASVSTQEGEAIAAGLQAPTFVTLLDLSKLQDCIRR